LLKPLPYQRTEQSFSIPLGLIKSPINSKALQHQGDDFLQHRYLLPLRNLIDVALIRDQSSSKNSRSNFWCSDVPDSFF
jgi:hypothetical protein